MPIFKIEIQDLLSKIVEIEAENIESALSKIKERYSLEEIVLDSENYIATEFIEWQD